MMSIGLLAATVGTVSAQQDASFAHYWAMETSFNPAAVGKQPVLNFTGAYALAMAGFENNPKTINVGADLPFYALGAYHGAGVQLMSDDIGLFNHQRVSLQYAYKHKLLGGTISVGLQGAMLSEKFKGSELDLETDNDDAFTKSDATGSSIDLSAGLYYQRGDWYAGLSMLHVGAPSIELGDRSIFDVSRTYYFTGGYNIRLHNPFLTIHPSVLARTDGTGYRVDATARVKYSYEQRMFYAGVAYSPTNSVTLLLGGIFHGITIGYSFELYTQGISFKNGSHELFMGYQTELNFSKKGRNRHQSVRLL